MIGPVCIIAINRNLRVFVHAKKRNNLDFYLVFDKFMWDKIIISLFFLLIQQSLFFLFADTKCIYVYLVDSEMSLKKQRNISERTDENRSKKINHCLQVWKVRKSQNEFAFEISRPLSFSPFWHFPSVKARTFLCNPDQSSYHINRQRIEFWWDQNNSDQRNKILLPSALKI